jgi:phosphoribosylformylglycinamidine synthase
VGCEQKYIDFTFKRFLCRGPTYHLTYTPTPIIYHTLTNTSAIRVAVIRQEGSNGDREMLAALHAAGIEAWDIHMRDLTSGTITVDRFQGMYIYI